MKLSCKIAFLTLTALLLAPEVSAATPASTTTLTPPNSAAGAQIDAAYGKLPLSFEANQGQADPQVKFLSRGSGYSLYLTATEAVLTPVSNNGSPTAVLRMKLVGASPKPDISGRNELRGRSNYFIGEDPAQWRTNVPNYAKVEYQEVYPGVDLVYYGNQQQLEFDFVVSPGADASVIRLAFENVDRLELDDQGDLVLYIAGKEIRLQKPFVYQESGGARRRIAGGYLLRNERQVSFQLAAYDQSKTLVIDPLVLLSFSSYLGGGGHDSGNDIFVDDQGNAYITGQTRSEPPFPPFPPPGPLEGPAEPFQPGLNGIQDAFVVKLNAAGSALEYATYLGGNSIDEANGIAVDSFGNAYVTGWTSSVDFPMQNAFQPNHADDSGDSDVFVAKLNATGSALLYSTYLGGGERAGTFSARDRGTDIALDQYGNAHVTGFTRSLDFPTTEPALPGVLNAFSSHAFVAKFDTTEVGEASLVYSKRLGGTATDVGNAIALDSGGNTYVTGRAGPKFPTTVGAFQTGFKLGGGDAFVAKIDITGNALIYSTFLGGMGLDEGFGITVDSFGNAYVVGQTSSADFPTAGPLGPFQALSGGNADAFVTKVDPLGSALVYSTYLGGSGFDVGRDIAIDQALRQAHVTGLTRSSDFPTLNAFQPSYGGGSGDAFVTRVGFSGSPMVYSTYLGGNSTEDGSGIAVIDRCSAYLTGFTLSPNFPTVNPLQGGLGGSADAFVGKLIWGDQPPSFLFLELSRDSIAANNHKLFEVNATIEVFDDCPDLSVELVSIVSNEPDEGLGDGDTPNDIQGADFGTDDRSFFLRAERSGTGDGRVYTVTYRAIDAGGQVAKRSATVTVTHDQSGH